MRPQRSRKREKVTKGAEVKMKVDLVKERALPTHGNATVHCYRSWVDEMCLGACEILGGVSGDVTANVNRVKDA